jgi:alpha-L-fucosidase
MPNGKIQDEHIKRLLEVGKWLKLYGETIYGTRGGVIAPHEAYVSTQKGKTLYLHILDVDQSDIEIPNFQYKIKQATFFKDKTPVRFTNKKDTLKLMIPENKKDDIDTVIEIILK